MINVIIPCLNEETSIGEVIRELKSSSTNCSKIIVVDNGSTDRTSEIAREYGAEVVIEPRRGKGFAFRKGLTRISEDCDLIFLVDGDFTYALEGLDQAANLVRTDGYDMVVGERINEVEIEAYRFGHRFGNRILTLFHNLMFGSEIVDTLSGWRLMTRGFALSFPAGASRFELETELNSHAFHLNSAVANFPVRYRARVSGSFSKLSTYSDGFKILRRNTNLWRSERPLLAYTSMSLPWFLASFVLLGRVLSTYIQNGLVPKFPSLIVSVGLFVIGANLWIAGVILERTNLHRTALARYIYLQEQLRINRLT